MHAYTPAGHLSANMHTRMCNAHAHTYTHVPPAFGFAEEILPFTDIIPTFTISWCLATLWPTTALARRLLPSAEGDSGGAITGTSDQGKGGGSGTGTGKGPL